MTIYRQLALDGALVAYGPDTLDAFHRTADYVDRILRGANPADLPAQAPIKYVFHCQCRDGATSRHHPAAGVARPRRRGDRMTRSE
jgi:hypothetical protein